MRKLILILTFLSTLFSTYAQSNAVDQKEDTTINVVAYFSKGDTMKYTLTTQKFKVENKDTTWKANYDEDFCITVLDSTAKGYRMELQYLDFDFSQTPNSKFNFENELTKESALASKGMKIIFNTDELGQVTKIENWTKVRDQLYNIFDKAIDNIYSFKTFTKEQRDSFNKILPIDKIKSITHMSINSEEAILKSIEELGLLFSNHGYSFAIGEKKEDSKQDNISHTITTTAGYTKIEDKDNDTEDDYLVINQRTSTTSIQNAIALAGVTDIVNLTFGDQYKDIIKDNFNSSLKDLKGNLVVKKIDSSEYWYNGWVKSILNATETTFLNEKNIELKAIEWSYYSFKGGENDGEDSKDTKKM